MRRVRLSDERVAQLEAMAKRHPARGKVLSRYAKYFKPLDPYIHGRWDQRLFGPHGINCLKHVLGCKDMKCNGECKMKL